jgi:hypothetical protein
MKTLPSLCLYMFLVARSYETYLGSESQRRTVRCESCFPLRAGSRIVLVKVSWTCAYHDQFVHFTSADRNVARVATCVGESRTIPAPIHPGALRACN